MKLGPDYVTPEGGDALTPYMTPTRRRWLKALQDRVEIEYRL